VTLPDAPSLTGYTFSGWSTTDAEIQDGVTGSWNGRTDISYLIKYFQQDLDGDDYSLADTVQGTGTTDAVIPDAHKDYAGFTETADSANAESSTTIAADGSTVLELYYDRSSYDVSFSYSGTVPDAAPALPAGATYLYGQTVTLPDTSLTGYLFSGWAVTSGGEAKYNAGDQITLSGRLTLYAVYQAAKPPAPALCIGYADGTFRPDETLTVGQTVRMLSRLGYGDAFTGEGMNAAEKVPRPVFLELLSTVTSAVTKDTTAVSQTAAGSFGAVSSGDGSF
jgi:hypothetical protein